MPIEKCKIPLWLNALGILLWAVVGVLTLAVMLLAMGILRTITRNGGGHVH